MEPSPQFVKDFNKRISPIEDKNEVWQKSKLPDLERFMEVCASHLSQYFSSKKDPLIPNFEICTLRFGESPTKGNLIYPPIDFQFKPDISGNLIVSVIYYKEEIDYSSLKRYLKPIQEDEIKKFEIRNFYWEDMLDLQPTLLEIISNKLNNLD